MVLFHTVYLTDRAGGKFFHIWIYDWGHNIRWRWLLSKMCLNTKEGRIGSTVRCTRGINDCSCSHKSLFKHTSKENPEICIRNIMSWEHVVLSWMITYANAVAVDDVVTIIITWLVVVRCVDVRCSMFDVRYSMCCRRCSRTGCYEATANAVDDCHVYKSAQSEWMLPHFVHLVFIQTLVMPFRRCVSRNRVQDFGARTCSDWKTAFLLKSGICLI